MISLELQIILALLLDLVLGDPRWLPHPVKLIGRLAVTFESFFRRFVPRPRIAGILTVAATLLVTGLAVIILLWLAADLHPLAHDLLAVVLLYTCLAARDLARHSQEVHAALAADDLPGARKKVALIVGRDTGDLDGEGVARACVESVAENIVDGVVAPLFFAVLAGPLGALFYKAVNTMDSLFGYKNERYEKFGWGAARLDDLVNFIPARLSGLLVIGGAALLNLQPGAAWRIFARDRLQHASPNAGQTEAAAAGALGLRFGGPSSYFGKPVEKPFIGEAIAAAGPVHIVRVNRILWVVTLLAVFFFLTIRWSLVKVGFFFF